MNDTPLSAALKNGDLTIARTLIEQGADIQILDSEGKTPLHHAAFWGAHDIVELLLERGTDVNSRDPDGLTPLHWAFHVDIQWDRLADHLAAARSLILAGADMKAQTNKNQTPWEYIGYPEFAQLIEGVPIDANVWGYVANRWDSRGRFEDALAAYQRTRELIPQDSLHIDVSYYISPANILIALNRYEEALALIEQAQTLVSKPPSIILERKAHILQRLGRDTEALATYQQSTDALPEDAQAWLEQGRILNELGRHDEALDVLQKASDLGTSELYDGWYVPHSVVKYLMEQGQYEDALRFIDRALEHEPERLNSWPLKWQILRKLDRQSDANDVEQRVMDHEPADAGQWYLKGEALDEFGRHEAAMAAFERACMLGDELPYNWLIPSTISHLCTHKRYTEALPFFKRAIEQEPADIETRMWYGRILTELERYDEVLSVYQQVAEREPDYARAWHDQGLILHQLGYHDEAITAYQKAVEVEPQYISAWNNLGVTFNDRQRYEEALTAFQRANLLNPREVWYVYNMAWALDKLKRSAEALPLLDRAIKLDGTHVQSWRLKGEILRQLGHDRKAASVYRQALELDPAHAQTWNRLGLVQDRLQCYEEALTAFQRATELDATEAWYPCNMAYVLTKLDRRDEALIWVNQALERDATHVPSWQRRGWILYKLERYEEAVTAYRQALDLDSNDASTWNRLGLALSRWSRHGEALAAFQRATELNANDVQYWDNLAYAHQMLKQYAESMQFVERALQCNPDYSPAQERKAWLNTKIAPQQKPGDAQSHSDETPLKTLIDRLNSGDFNVIEALWQMGKQAFEPLVEALDHSNPAIPFRAAKALGKLGDPHAVKLLQKRLAHTDLSVGAAAGTALAQLGEQGLAVLLESVRDPVVRTRAVLGLNNLSLANDRVFNAFVTALDDSSDAVRRRAVEHAIEPRALEPLLERVLDDSAIWQDAVWYLADFGGRRVTELFLRVLNDQTVDERLRRHIAEHLWKLHAPQCVDPLITALADPSAGVRGFAARSLGSLGDERAILPLVELLSDTAMMRIGRESQPVCNWAAGALYRMFDARETPTAPEPWHNVVFAIINDPSAGLELRYPIILLATKLRNPRAVEPLIAASSDADPFLRSLAVTALGELGDPRAIPALIPLLADTEPEMGINGGHRICQRAIDALAKINTPEAIATLETRRKGACKYGTMFHPHDNLSFNQLVAKLKAGDHRTIDALAKLEERAVPPLVEALNHANSTAVFHTVIALGELGDERAVKPLQQRLGNEDPSGEKAGIALSQLGERGLMALLESARDPNQRVRMNALDGLKQLPLTDERVFDAVIQALSDPDYLVRMRALEAMRQPSVIEPLIARLPDDSSIWSVGIWALARQGGPRVAKFFMVILNDQTLDVRLRKDIAHAMCDLYDPHVVDALIIALNDPNPAVRGQAAYSLGELGNPRAIPELSKLLDDIRYMLAEHPPRVCDMAAKALDKLRNSDDSLS